MGLYNQDQKNMSMKLPVGLQEFQCPFGHGAMISIAWKELAIIDAYHYKCEHCSKVSIIQIAGNMVSDLEDIFKKNTDFLPAILKKMAVSKAEFYKIGRSDFPNA